MSPSKKNTNTNAAAAAATTTTAAAPTNGASHRGGAARPNPDMSVYNRFGGSEQSGKVQQERWVEYGFEIDEFDKATKRNRGIYQYGVTQKTLRDSERIKVEKLIADAKEAVRDGEARMAAMQAADDQYKAQYGSQYDQGEAETQKLEKYRGYLSLAHDEEPTELH